MKNSLLVLFVLTMFNFSAQAVTLDGKSFTISEYNATQGVDARRAYFQKFRDAALAELSRCTSNCAELIKKIKDTGDSPYQRCVAGVFKRSCGIIDVAVKDKESSTGASDTARAENEEKEKGAVADRTCKAARDKIAGLNASLLNATGSCAPEGSGISYCNKGINQYYKKLAAISKKACNYPYDISMLQKSMTGACTAGENSEWAKTDFLNDTRNIEIIEAVEAGRGYTKDDAFQKLFGLTYREFNNIYCGAINKKAQLTTKKPLNEMTSADIFDRAVRDLKESDKGKSFPADVKAKRDNFYSCVSQGVTLDKYDRGEQGREDKITVVGTNMSTTTCSDRSLFAEGQNTAQQIKFLNKYKDLVYVQDPRTGACFTIKSVDQNLDVQLESLPGEYTKTPSKFNIIQNMKEGMSWQKQFNAHLCTGGSTKSDAYDMLRDGDGSPRR